MTEPDPTPDPEPPTTFTEMEFTTMTASTSLITGRPQKDIRLKIDGEFIEAQVSSCIIKAKQIEWKGGTPAADLIDATHEVEITAIQAFDDEDSFSRIALALRGQRVEIEWQPHADSPFKVTSNILIPYFDFGGKVGLFNEFTLVCKATDPVPVTA